MLHVALEDLLDKTDSIYKLTVLAARRALELNMGVPKLIETTDKNSIVVALEEIAEGKVSYKDAKK